MADAAPERTLVPPGAHVGPDRKAVLAVFDRGRDEVGQLPAAIPREGRVERPEGHRGRDRLVADLVDRSLEEEAEAVLGLAPNEVRPHVGAGGERRAAVEVEHPVHAPPREVDVHGAEAGHPAHERIDRGLDERARDRGVDRVPAFPQHVGPGLRRLRLRGGDDSLHGPPSPCDLLTKHPRPLITKRPRPLPLPRRLPRRRGPSRAPPSARGPPGRAAGGGARRGRAGGRRRRSAGPRSRKAENVGEDVVADRAPHLGDDRGFSAGRAFDRSEYPGGPRVVEVRPAGREPGRVVGRGRKDLHIVETVFVEVAAEGRDHAVDIGPRDVTQLAMRPCPGLDRVRGGGRIAGHHREHREGVPGVDVLGRSEPPAPPSPGRPPGRPPRRRAPRPRAPCAPSWGSAPGAIP